jgi:hypothetical protein
VVLMAAVASPITRSSVHEVGASGTYNISGTVKVEAGAVDTPVYRRVRLHDQPTGRLLREVWSAAGTGAWTFEGIRAGVFFVMTRDHTGVYNGEIVTDIVVPAP